MRTGTIAIVLAGAVLALPTGLPAQEPGVPRGPAAGPGTGPGGGPRGPGPDRMIERGRYLTAVMGCADCHAPLKMGPKGPERDLSRGLSGHPEGMALPPPPAPTGPWITGGAATNTAFYGPWGVSYAANLTPDPETGLGRWTAQTFVQALKTGKHLGVGRPIVPPMPIEAYRNASERDLRSVFAYLRSQPAVRNKVPDWAPPQGSGPAAAGK